MDISSQRAGAPNLYDTIKQYRREQQDKLDKRALTLLARLADSPDAAKAFKRLKPHHRDVPGVTAVHGSNLLLWCTQAELVYRAFPQEITKAKERLVQKERLDTAVAELRKFVAAQNAWPPFGKLSPANIATMKHGLDLIVERIDECRHDARDTEPRLGATRKTQVKEAAENAAIWFLANNVQFATGKPHWQEVANLAHVILETDVTAERVRHAVRKRNPPFFNPARHQRQKVARSPPKKP
jgi:hypothetical protein